MEWTLGKIDISLEIDLGDHAGEWIWIDLSDIDKEGEKALNMDDNASWAWLATEFRRLGELAG